MRAIIILVVLGLLFLLVKNSASLDLRTDQVNPVILGYGALFAGGIVAAELLRPLLSLLGATSRFVVVAIIAAMVWVGFEGARNAGRIPEALLNPEARPTDAEIAPQTRLQVSWDGVYRAVAQVNNMSLGVMVDTGTPLVLLQYSEAERLGMQPQRLKFDQRVSVADRKINAATLRLFSVRIDTIELLNVEGAIAAPGELETSVVGLSFLHRLSNVALIKEELFLRQ